MPTVPDLYPVIIRQCAEWTTLPDITALVQCYGVMSARTGELIERHAIANHLRSWERCGLLRQRQSSVRPINEEGLPTGRPYMEYRATTRSFDPMLMAKAMGDGKAREILRRLNGTDSASMTAQLDQDDEQLRLIEDTFGPEEIHVQEVQEQEDEGDWTEDYAHRQQLAHQESGAVPVPSNKGTAPGHPRLPLRPDRFFDARFTSEGVLITYDEFHRITQLLSYVTMDEPMEDAG